MTTHPATQNQDPMTGGEGSTMKRKAARHARWWGYAVGIVAALASYPIGIGVATLLSAEGGDPVSTFAMSIWFGVLSLVLLGLPILVVGIGSAVLIEEVLLRRVRALWIHLLVFAVVGFAMAALVGLGLQTMGGESEVAGAVEVGGFIFCLLTGAIPAVLGRIALIPAEVGRLA